MQGGIRFDRETEGCWKVFLSYSFNFSIKTNDIYSVFFDLPLFLYCFMFSLVIWFYSQFYQRVLAPSNKAHPMVFVVIRLSWKGVSRVYCTSLVDISVRSNPQSSASMTKDICLLMILVNSYSITFISCYENKMSGFLLLAKTPTPQGVKR